MAHPYPTFVSQPLRGGKLWIDRVPAAISCSDLRRSFGDGGNRIREPTVMRPALITDPSQTPAGLGLPAARASTGHRPRGARFPGSGPGPSRTPRSPAPRTPPPPPRRRRVRAAPAPRRATGRPRRRAAGKHSRQQSLVLLQRIATGVAIFSWNYPAIEPPSRDDASPTR